MEHEKTTNIIGYSTLFLVWFALICLTGLTVFVASIDLGRLGILVNILFATLKSILVLFIFMHMKFEPWIIKCMLFMVVITLTAIIVLTFFDVLYR
jgi:cytochrome c oxidase subunit 4